MTCRKWIVAAALVLAAAQQAGAKQQRVVLKDGGIIVGEVTKADGRYRVVMASGATVTIPAERVASVGDVETARGEYERRLAKIDPNSAEDHFKLANWAYESERYEIAAKELKAALKIDPDYEPARLLRQMVRAKLKRPTTREGPDEGTDRLLSMKDIYRIRLEELREDDRRVAVKFRNDVVERFIKAMEGKGDFKEPKADDAFRRQRPGYKAWYIRNQMPDNVAVKEDIQVRTDPIFMRNFRRIVWPMVRSHCAAAQCHGGPRPKGGLMLFGGGGRNVRADYTNFIMLDGWVSRGRRVINRNSPKDSLLLQFALPEEQASVKHPKDISDVFRDRRDRSYQLVLEWIDSLRGPPHPEYRLRYKPPFGIKIVGRKLPSFLDDGGATTRPATTRPRADDGLFD
jgi:hypothetical protein